MNRKCLRVCNFVILSSIGGLMLCLLKSWKVTNFEHMANFWSKVNFFKKCPNRFESVICDQEMSQSVQYSDFKPDWWTFSMFLEQLKNYKFWNTGSTLAQQWNFAKCIQTYAKVSPLIRKCIKVYNSVSLRSIGRLLPCFLKASKHQNLQDILTCQSCVRKFIILKRAWLRCQTDN